MIKTEQMNLYKHHLSPNSKGCKILNFIQEELSALREFPQADEAFNKIKNGHLTISTLAAIWLWKKTLRI